MSLNGHDHTKFCPVYRWDILHRKSRITERDIYEHFLANEIRERNKIEINLNVPKLERMVKAQIKRNVVQSYLKISQEIYNSFGSKMLQLCNCPDRRELPPDEEKIVESLDMDKSIEPERKRNKDEFDPMEERRCKIIKETGLELSSEDDTSEGSNV